MCRIPNQIPWCWKLHTDVNDFDFEPLLLIRRASWAQTCCSCAVHFKKWAGLALLTNQRSSTHLNILACQSCFPPPSRAPLSILNTSFNRHIGYCEKVCLLFLSLRTELTERFQFLCTLFSWFAETSWGLRNTATVPVSDSAAAWHKAFCACFWILLRK